MMKFVYITYILSITVTVVTVKKMTIMTNDNSIISTPIDTMVSYVCPFSPTQPSGRYALHCNDSIFKYMRK